MNGTHQTPLLDRCRRRVTYLRLSLTEACAMRCVYCRPRRHGVAMDRPLLSVHEIGQLVEHLTAHHGLRKVRLTGGDPTSRPDLTAIIERIAAVPGIEDLAMTTHGLTLAGHAAEYARAGLRRVNVSLDTLDRDRFEKMTGVDGLTNMLAGLEAAESAGLHPIRINTVVVRGRNDGDLADLARWSARRGWDIRFIELMPMGPLAAEWADRYVPEAEMRRSLGPIVRDWEPIDQGHDAARRYRVTFEDGSTTTLGFITPMSCNFCAACNRIRIASDATLYPCLMDRPGPSLLPALRPRFDAEAIDRLIETGLSNKRPEHPAQGHVAMVQLGG
ncbi:MAG: GTP 3',8-cyclase MoaA [Phycisphaeraceae bacterium]|nr:GTP 3',8-cyclase MoaA [Phycisphaeraceae bacterium]